MLSKCYEIPCLCIFNYVFYYPIKMLSFMKYSYLFVEAIIKMILLIFQSQLLSVHKACRKSKAENIIHKVKSNSHCFPLLSIIINEKGDSGINCQIKAEYSCHQVPNYIFIYSDSEA